MQCLVQLCPIGQQMQIQGLAASPDDWLLLSHAVERSGSFVTIKACVAPSNNMVNARMRNLRSLLRALSNTKRAPQTQKTLPCSPTHRMWALKAQQIGGRTRCVLHACTANPWNAFRLSSPDSPLNRPWPSHLNAHLDSTRRATSHASNMSIKIGCSLIRTRRRPRGGGRHEIANAGAGAERM